MRKMLILALVVPVAAMAEEAKKPAEAPKAPAAAAAPAAPAPKAPPADAAAKVEKKAAATELKVGTGLEKKELVGAAEEFKVAADTKIWAWAKVAGLAADAKVTLAFFKGDKQAYKQDFQAAGSPWRVNAYKTFRAGDAGDWVVKLLGPDGAELAAAKFKVEITK
jgi:hypothetical protein